ncbi:MAG: type II toxin-antitoxin system HicA family toxin [Bacteroidota bacterium]
MGRYSGFRYREVAKRLKKFGFYFYRQAAGSHEIWRHNESGKFTTIPNHPGDMPEGTLRAILRQADIEPETFLKTK